MTQREKMEIDTLKLKIRSLHRFIKEAKQTYGEDVNVSTAEKDIKRYRKELMKLLEK